MIVVHFESGLGNQMLNYAEYLALKKEHPNEKIYYENLIYELNDVQNKINMWNGYELESIFNIKMVNISEVFTKDEWQDILEEVRESKFWENGWNYSESICGVLNNHGLCLKNEVQKENRISLKSKIIDSFYKTWGGYAMKRFLSYAFPKIFIYRKSRPNELFCEGKHDIYTGQKLLFLYKENRIEEIKENLINSFKFPPILENTKNYEILNLINETNAVAIHIRRGDMLYANEYLYKFGYFKRAIKKIRKKIELPYFFIFGDTDSSNWIAENPRRVGLKKNDKIIYVNWNSEKESFRDMQLMTYCKGVVITNSTFGWWGAFLNQNSQKITISPFVNYNTTDWV